MKYRSFTHLHTNLLEIDFEVISKKNIEIEHEKRYLMLRAENVSFNFLKEMKEPFINKCLLNF